MRNFRRAVEQENATLSPPIKPDRLAALEDTPRPASCKKLKARDGYRIPVGDYRVIYEIDDGARIVRILAIGHRREIYQ